jgi:thiosulfate/3-mercaptopyruvate sulfurtransferase
MSRVLLAAAVLFGAAVAAPAQPARNASPGVLVSTSDLASMLGDPSLVVLHVAERPAQFEEAHIPGARFLRYGDFAVDGVDDVGSELPPADQLKRVFEALGVSNGSRVVLYGTSPVTASRAFFTLDAAGHRNVKVLDGGMRTWRAEGRPTETGPSRQTTTGTFAPRIDTARIATAQFIQQQMTSSGISLIDVRPDPEFLGTDGGMGGRHAAGHIAGAKQLTWNALVAEDGRFLPRETLQMRLAAAGAAAGKPVVAYCMVGMRASVVYLVARHLGYDARLYDGSIIDWSQKKLPVVTGRQ